MYDTAVYFLLNLIRRYPDPAFDRTKLSHRLKRRVRWALSELAYATESWTDNDAIARLIEDEKYDEAEALLNKMESFWPGESAWTGARWEIEHARRMPALREAERAEEEKQTQALMDSFIEGVDTGVVWSMNELVDLHDGADGEENFIHRSIAQATIEDAMRNIIAAAPPDIIDSMQSQPNMDRAQLREWLGAGPEPKPKLPAFIMDNLRPLPGSSQAEIFVVAEPRGDDVEAQIVFPSVEPGEPIILGQVELPKTIDIDDGDNS
jgi:hypothetical protein